MRWPRGWWRSIVTSEGDFVKPDLVLVDRVDLHNIYQLALMIEDLDEYEAESLQRVAKLLHPSAR